MLRDPLLQARYERHLNELIELAEKEIHRTRWEKPFHELALFYHSRFGAVRDAYAACGRDLVGAFGKFQELGIWKSSPAPPRTRCCRCWPIIRPPCARRSWSRATITGAALAASRGASGCRNAPMWRAWRTCCRRPTSAGSSPTRTASCTPGRGRATRRLRPIFTPNGIAAFGRDPDSARQVWSRHAGYPGDPRYRDFYRDIGFDLDLDYVKPHLPAPGQRGFTGLKYYRITGSSPDKEVYDRQAAIRAADEHAGHFLDARLAQFRRLAEILDRPPIVVAPYDAELFGHWWYEGPEFLDFFVRKACCDQKVFELITPGEFLRRHPTHQVATPAASSWGEEGYWRVWLNEKNEWIYPHLRVAQERMTELARRFPQPDALAGAHAQASRPRTAPRPSQRLAVHPPHRHQPRLRAQAGEGAPAALHPALRAAHRRPTRPGMAQAGRVAGQYLPGRGLPLLGLAVTIQWTLERTGQTQRRKAAKPQPNCAWQFILGRGYAAQKQNLCLTTLLRSVIV